MIKIIGLMFVLVLLISPSLHAKQNGEKSRRKPIHVIIPIKSFDGAVEDCGNGVLTIHLPKDVNFFDFSGFISSIIEVNNNLDVAAMTVVGHNEKQHSAGPVGGGWEIDVFIVDYYMVILKKK